MYIFLFIENKICFICFCYLVKRDNKCILVKYKEFSYFFYYMFSDFNYNGKLVIGMYIYFRF